VFTICTSVIEEPKHPSLNFCKFLYKCDKVNKTCLHKRNWKTKVQVWTFASSCTKTIKKPNSRYTITTFVTTKRNPNISIIDQPSTCAPLHEHNHFRKKKRNGGGGTISSTSHLIRGCSFDDSFFTKPKVVKKTWPWLNWLV
jgi:hypothetical protein